MYKISNNKQEFETINQTAVLKDSTCTEFSNIIKHCKDELYAFNIGENDILRSILLSYNLPFITEEWLNTDIVSELPNDWTWYYETSMRIIIPNYLILSDDNLRNLITYCIENDVLHIIDKDNTWLYVNYILPEHLALLESFDEIKIENY